MDRQRAPGAAHLLRAADEEGVAAAVAALRAGGLVGLPTETVYGLAADAGNAHAVAALFAAKSRPHFNPLIAHVPDRAAAEGIAAFTLQARACAEAFWPGPLTLVLPYGGGAGVCDLARAGLKTVAVRVPAHPVALRLLRALARPLAAPSANPSGGVSPTRPEHVLADLGNAVACVLDGGPCAVGLESTILDLSEAGAPRLLRPGAVSAEALSAVLGRPVLGEGSPGEDASPRAPGQLASHYAPRARVRLEARAAGPDEALLAFGPAPAHAGPMLNLSEGGDVVEAAANLFAHLRALDAAGVEGIAVMPIPETGLGRAIRDRLARAAAPRSAPVLEA